MINLLNDNSQIVGDNFELNNEEDLGNNERKFS